MNVTFGAVVLLYCINEVDASVDRFVNIPKRVMNDYDCLVTRISKVDLKEHMVQASFLILRVREVFCRLCWCVSCYLVIKKCTMGICMSGEADEEPSTVIGVHELCDVRRNLLEEICHDLRARQQLSDKNVRDLVIQLGRCIAELKVGQSRVRTAEAIPLAGQTSRAGPPLILKSNGAGYMHVYRV